MAKWTLSEYSHLPTDGEGNPIPIGRKPRNSQGSAVAATFALGNGTRYIRFCGDTAAHVALAGAATTNDDYVPAGQDYWLATDGAAQLTFIVG